MSTTATEATATPTNKVSYRRNGKLFSCEPCRKGKLRCDHSSPVCGRCARRGKPDQCVYHPAPLTKQRAPGNENPKDASFAVPALPIHSTQQTSVGSSPDNAIMTSSAGLQRVSGPATQPVAQQEEHRTTLKQGSSTISPSSRYSPYPSVTLGNSSISSRTTSRNGVVPMDSSMSQPATVRDERANSSATASIATPESCMSYRDSKHGFMGPTAFTAVFTENSASTGFDDLDSGIDAEEPTPISLEKIQQGAEVLAMLRDMPLFRQFTRRWSDLYDGLIVPQPMFRIWFDDLWDEWEPIFTRGTPAQLLRLSEHVFRNTRQPIKTHQQMSAVEYTKALTGRNVRWEVIGLILSLVGLVAVNVNDWDNIFDDMQETPLDRAKFAERLRKMSERCLCFCYECEALNDVYVCFMHQDLVLVECMKGDVHYAAWQRTGELLDTVVAMGLHRGNYVDAETPFWLSQLRRKLFVSSFSRDKTVACFLGRPPRLSYRYCKLEMPLDLNDDELFAEGAELDTAVAQLDANGWHTSGRLSRRTWTRVWFQECLIREEILEIALGSGDDDLDERVEKVQLKLARVHRTFPPGIQLSPDVILGGGQGPTNRCERYVRQINALYVVCINAGLMLTEFLLQRAVVNRGKGDTKTLIPVARKLLQTTLLAQSRRDFFKDYRGDIVYLLASYGLPSAGVLAIELLKQEQTRQYEPELLPKSETIQDLSVFISALASISPGEGNYNICNQGRRALKRVLDQILAPPPPTTTDQAALDDMSLYFPTGNDADFLQWLDNVDWNKNLMVPQLLQDG